MEFVRTPDERFSSVPDFPFLPHYLDNLASTKGGRLHYLDEGDQNSSEVFLCLHGEPTWSFLYRKMIPIFTSFGHRVIAPDLLGFGKSDKPTRKEHHTFEYHRNILLELIQHLGLKNITLVCQDWGGVLGLTLPMEIPERFKRLLVMNTALCTGDLPFNFSFLLWYLWAKTHPNLNVGQVLKFSEPRLRIDEEMAYNAPFPDKTYKIAPHYFPSMVPIRYEDQGASISRHARDWWNKSWQGDTFMAVGQYDPVLGEKTMFALSKIIRNCPPPQLFKAGHFVQERGEIVAKAALEYFGLNKQLSN